MIYRSQRIWLSVLSITASLLAAGARSQTRQITTLGAGANYHRITDPHGPLSIHVLEIDRRQPDLHLAASVGTAIKGKETVAQMASAIPKKQGIPLAAVNGGYFEFTKQPRFFGVPSGLSIVDGELLHGPKSTALCINSKGQPSIRRMAAKFSLTWPDGGKTPFGLNGPTSDFESSVKPWPIVLFTPRFHRSTGTDNIRELILGPVDDDPWLPLRPGQEFKARVMNVRSEGDTEIEPGRMVLSISQKAEASTPTVQAGDVLQISVAFDRDMSDVVTAVSGEPQLLTRGQPPPKPADKPGSRAPRTLVGFNDTHIFIAVVDGRQEKSSIGMSFSEAAEFMHQLGCTEAINLDGGGSSTFWLNGRIINAPSDGFPRTIGDCLLLLQRTEIGGSGE